MFELAEQCCDATLYLELAQQCAASGQCYNPLRPLGSQWWFALPLLLGLPISTAVFGHWLLLVISALLAARACYLVLQRLGLAACGWVQVLIAVLLLGIHTVVFWPVMDVTLSDAPAGLSALIGVWLVLLSGFYRHRQKALLLLFAGVLLGLAVITRAFYLYPVLIFSLLFFAWHWRCKSLQLAHAALLALLLPLGVQFAATWQHTGQLGLIDPAMSKQFSGLHFRHNGIGYDSQLPGRAVVHFDRCQTQRDGLIGAVMSLNVAELWCLLSRRVYFYAASDMRTTYIAANGFDNVTLYPERFELVGAWLRYGLDIEVDAALAPNGQQTAEKMTLVAGDYQGSPDMSAVVISHEQQHYTGSVWLWAAKPLTVQLRWLNFWGGAEIAVQEYTLSTTPQRLQVSAQLGEGNYYFNILFNGAALGDEVFIWGAQIDKASAALPYQIEASPVAARNWLPWLGLVNATLLLMSLYLWWQVFSKSAAFVQHHAVNAFCANEQRQSARIELGCVLLLALLILAQSIVIVPEQRFIVLAQTIVWSFGALGLMLWSRRFIRRLRTE